MKRKRVVSENPYHIVLAEDDSYETPADARKPVVFNPKWYFFRKLLGIIFRSASSAKQNQYSGVDWANSSSEVIQALEEVGVRFSISGMKNLTASDKPAVIIGNHMSTMETMVLPALIQPVKETTFVVKEELMNFPVFKHVLATRDPIVIGRSNPREDLKLVLTTGKAKLQNGTSIILFPQRTRGVQFDPEQFNSLGIKLARRSGVNVIPLALVTDAWENGNLIKEYGRINPNKTVHISFGEPISVTGSGANEHQQVLDFIVNQFRIWDREDCLKPSVIEP